MKNKVYDFQKAIEQKQKRVEIKDKHAPTSNTLEKEVIRLIEGNEDIQDMLMKSTQDVLEEYKELGEKYCELANKYQDAVNNTDKTLDMLERVSNSNDRYSYFSALTEHFIVKNDLEQEFIEFIKDVAENETVKEYRQAAQFKDGFYRMEIEDYGTTMMIDDEYGWLKEEEKEESN